MATAATPGGKCNSRDRGIIKAKSSGSYPYLEFTPQTKED